MHECLTAPHFHTRLNVASMQRALLKALPLTHNRNIDLEVQTCIPAIVQIGSELDRQGR